MEIEDWIKFYDETYVFKGRCHIDIELFDQTSLSHLNEIISGKLEGNFYDKDGNPSVALKEAVKKLEEAHANKRIRDAENARTPPCNTSQNKDKRFVWCTERR